MLVTEEDDHYRIVTQTEHANQVGRLAAHWGTETVDVPPPRVPTTIAAYTHDNGWWEWDLAPELRDGGPANLHAVRKPEWTAFYDRGIDNAVEVDPYAGLLVSMHGVGVRCQRYGTQPSFPSFAEEYAAFIAQEERRQRDLVETLRDSERYGDHVDAATVRFLSRLHDEGAADADDTDTVPLWAHYKLLQVWDRLSLYWCFTEERAAETVDPVPVGADADVELALDPVDETTVSVDPYPFDTSPLSVSVRCRRIPRRTYESQAALTRAYYAAEQEVLECTFQRPEGI